MNSGDRCCIKSKKNRISFENTQLSSAAELLLEVQQKHLSISTKENTSVYSNNLIVFHVSKNMSVLIFSSSIFRHAQGSLECNIEEQYFGFPNNLFLIENPLIILLQRTKNLTINIAITWGRYDYSVYILQQQKKCLQIHGLKCSLENQTSRTSHQWS